MTAAAHLSVEKRSVFLERIAARLRLRDAADVELDAAVRTALTGLIQQKPAA